MKLKELVLSNPDLPVVIKFMNDEDGEHERCYEEPDAVIGEVFRNEEYLCDDVYGVPYTDRDMVTEKLFEELSNGMTEDKFVQKVLPKYESYWAKCILVEL